MLRPYREVLSLPGAFAFSSAAFLARLPISMLSIGFVLLVVGSGGSYGLAGAVTATFGLVAAVAAPQLARLVDRYGQARVLRRALGVQVAGILGLVLLVRHHCPLWATFATAVVAGLATVQIGALVRARWAVLVRGSQLHAAYSLESSLDELIFIIGPVLVTVLAVRVNPALGPVVAAGALATGGLLLAAQRRTQPAPAPRAPTHRTDQRPRPVLAVPGILVLAITFTAVGAIFGACDVATVAFTAEQGHRGDAGPVLAVFAAGSMIAGLGYGAIRWRASAARRLVIGVVLLAAGVVPFALVDRVPTLAAAMFLAGLTISPTIVAGYGVVASLVPEGQLTEGLTWAVTGMNLGANVSVALTGVVVDAFGGHRAFLVAVGAGAVSVLLVLTGSRWLHPATVRDTGPRPTVRDDHGEIAGPHPCRPAGSP